MPGRARRRDGSGGSSIVVSLNQPLNSWRDAPLAQADRSTPRYGRHGRCCSSIPDFCSRSCSQSTCPCRLSAITLKNIARSVGERDNLARHAAMASRCRWHRTAQSGGRQLGSTFAPLEVLPPVVDAVGSRMGIFVDGGVRRGSDALKVVALGAGGILLRRAIVWTRFAGCRRRP
jgi:(S)-mandelate dehydrogenase